jgi:hypothetical protein
MDSPVKKLLTSDCRERWCEPFTAEELLSLGRAAFEPLFHEPSLGPIPEYISVHGSVYGCVAEYEDRIEELDDWKVLQLSRWLRKRIGRRWCIGGSIYELQAARNEDADSEKFRFSRIED